MPSCAVSFPREHASSTEAGSGPHSFSAVLQAPANSCSTYCFSNGVILALEILVQPPIDRLQEMAHPRFSTAIHERQIRIDMNRNWVLINVANSAPGTFNREGAPLSCQVSKCLQRCFRFVAQPLFQVIPQVETDPNRAYLASGIGGIAKHFQQLLLGH